MLGPKVSAYLSTNGFPSFWEWWTNGGRERVYSQIVYGKITN